MSDLKCQASACDQHPTTHITRAQGRRVVDVIHLCDHHARSYFEDQQTWYNATSRVGTGQPFAMGKGFAFEVDFLYCDELQDRPWGRHYVQLIEAGGHRLIGFFIGVEASSALNFELHRSHSPRPLTHRGMAAAISALGGQLQYVEIDKYFPAEQGYEAKLHIRQMNTDVIVDVRPSDALILALICDVPIIVSKEVLAALSEEGH